MKKPLISTASFGVFMLLNGIAGAWSTSGTSTSTGDLGCYAPENSQHYAKLHAANKAAIWCKEQIAWIDKSSFIYNRLNCVTGSCESNRAICTVEMSYKCKKFWQLRLDH